MKKLLLLLNVSVFVQSTSFTSSDTSEDVNIVYPQEEARSIDFKDTRADFKIKFLEQACQSLIVANNDIQKQALVLLKHFQSNPSSSLIVPVQEIGINLENIELCTQESAWCNHEVDYSCWLEIEQINSNIKQILNELDVTLEKVRDLLVRCDKASIELNTDVSIGELDGLRSIIFRLKLLNALFYYSKVSFKGVILTNPVDWVAMIQSLPKNVRKIDLGWTNIDTDGLRELSRLSHLEEINLYCVKITNPAYWVAMIHSLPTTMRKIDLGWTNIDASKLVGLSRLSHLEEVNLSGVRFSKQPDWVTVIRSFPLSLKKINFYKTKIDASGLVELSRFTSLEELGLPSIRFRNRNDWVSVIQSLPASVKKLDLVWTNIDTSGLRELSRLTSLEDIMLGCVTLTHPADWAIVLEAFPLTLKKIDLRETNIDPDGIRALSRFTRLEDISFKLVSLTRYSDWTPLSVSIIDVSETHLSTTKSVPSEFRELPQLTSVEETEFMDSGSPNPVNWVAMIQSLPTTLKKIDLEWTSIDADGLRALSRFTSLEEITLSSVRLRSRADWVSVIQSLPVTVRRVAFCTSNCPDDLSEELRSRGIIVD